MKVDQALTEFDYTASEINAIHLKFKNEVFLLPLPVKS
jgi:hypothetical protein